jgi:hypothetical protein
MDSGKQKGLILMVSEAFLAEIDRAYPNLGYGDRASFVRAAVHEYLQQNGVNLPLSYKAAPPRVGKSKGGRPRKEKAVEPTLLAATDQTEYVAAKSKRK